MKRLSSRHLPRLVAEISVTPLLDLMLLLLLVVIVLVPELRPLKSKGSALSSDQAGAPAAVPKKTLELLVAADLKLTLDGKGIEPRDLIADLKKRVTAEPELGVIVRIPAALPAPRLLEIMEALRAAEIRHSAVTVNPVKKP
jgi:biopolymer transport protein ExbD